MIKFSVKQLLNFNIHVGYSVNRWNPKYSTFIYGSRNSIHIINLELTVYMLRRALFFISEIIRHRENLLFINLKLGSYKYLNTKTQKYGQFVVNRYVGGLLTNFSNVKLKYKNLELLRRIPKAIFVSDISKCPGIITECRSLAIPLIGIADSNFNPEYFDYPIPGNTASLVSSKFYYNLFIKAVHLGFLKQRLKYTKLYRQRNTFKRNT